MLRVAMLLVRACFVCLLAGEAFPQAEYVDYGTTATIFGGGAAFSNDAHQYGVTFGRIAEGVWDADIHYAWGRNSGVPVQQLGAKTSLFFARSRERTTPFFGLRVSFDYYNAGEGKSGSGIFAVTPAVAGAVTSNTTLAFAWVPSVSLSVHKFFGKGAPSPTGEFQGSAGCRWKFHSGTVIFLEPGVTISSPSGRRTTTFYFLIGFLPVI